MILGEFLRLAKSVLGDGRSQEFPDSIRKFLRTVDAAFRKRLVVLVSSARIRVTGEGQVRIRLDLQVSLEVRCQSVTESSAGFRAKPPSGC